MMKRVFLIAALAAGLVTAAWAIQPGTTGTNKQYQQQGFRTGVLIQRNNTATASSGAATLNQAGSGVITSEALTTTAGSDYTLTLTNNMVAAADVVLASANLGSATQGVLSVKTVTPAAGSVVFIVRNDTGTGQATLAGTIQVRFLVVKQSALGSD